MPIIPHVGRRSAKVRFVIAFVYTFLTVGAVTMIYPFSIMLATASSSDVEYQLHLPFPRYLIKSENGFHDILLWGKYLSEKYFGDYLGDLNAKHAVKIDRLDQFMEYEEVDGRQVPLMNLPRVDTDDARVRRRIDEWYEAKRLIPADMRWTYYWDKWLNGRVQKRYQVHMREVYGSVEAYNDVHIERINFFYDVEIYVERFDGHNYLPESSLESEEWEAFEAELPPDYIRVFWPTNVLAPWLEVTYNADIDELNEEWGTEYEHFYQVRLPHAVEELGRMPQAVWRDFVHTKWPLRYVRLRGGSDEAYRTFLSDKYGDIESYRRRTGSASASFAEMELPYEHPTGAIEFLDWVAFVDAHVDDADIEIVSPESLYRDRLAEKYGGVEAVNEAYGTSFASMDEVRPPFAEADFSDFWSRRGELRRYFLGINYRNVFRFLVLRGRAVLVTVIFIVSAIATQLTVMPLAAFALSRFRLPYTHRILLFLLATMAFPGEVSMIPNFLLMKEMHLLNSLWALILPSVANGFFIFLLKGFFDSLPPELYEAAQIEGASELRMFATITLPLSKPIMAVIALGAFGAAYGSFTWALLINQNRNWWTIMVFLFEFQQTQPQYVVMSSLVLAAIPTLLVFIFCQNIILRGIIIPTFK